MPTTTPPETTETTQTQADVPSIYNETKTQISVSRAHPTFIIQLASNPTTGYSWGLQPYNQNMVVLVGHRFIAPKPGLMGAPGVEEWAFIAKNAAFKDKHNTTIQFDYARSWEKTVGKQVIFTVLFTKP